MHIDNLEPMEVRENCRCQFLQDNRMSEDCGSPETHFRPRVEESQKPILQFSRLHFVAGDIRLWVCLFCFFSVTRYRDMNLAKSIYEFVSES